MGLNYLRKVNYSIFSGASFFNQGAGNRRAGGSRCRAGWRYGGGPAGVWDGIVEPPHSPWHARGTRNDNRFNRGGQLLPGGAGKGLKTGLPTHEKTHRIPTKKAWQPMIFRSKKMRRTTPGTNRIFKELHPCFFHLLLVWQVIDRLLNIDYQLIKQAPSCLPMDNG